MLDDGVPAQSIMVALKLGRSTYFQWKRKYQEHGLNGLKVRPLPGAASKLTDQQTSQLRGWLVGRDPRQFQFDFALWTRRIVRDLIRQQFDVEMTPQGVGKLLHRLGLSPQRPLYRAYQQDPEAVRRWKEERFPAIRAQARREGAEVYFGDESGVRTDHHAGTTWAPVGQTPVVEVTGERTSVNMISAVSPGGRAQVRRVLRQLQRHRIRGVPEETHARCSRARLPGSRQRFLPQSPDRQGLRRIPRGSTEAVLPSRLLPSAQSRRVGVEERQTRRHQAQGHPARVRAVRNRHSCVGAPPATSGDHPGILPGSRSGLYRYVSESPLATFPIGKRLGSSAA